MKQRGSIILLASLISILTHVSLIRADLYYRRLFERTLYFMEATGRPDALVGAFREIAIRYPHDRYYAARSHFYMALCLKKMGSPEASRAFEEVISMYPDQTDVAAIARAELAQLKEPTPERQASAQAAETKPHRIWQGNSVYGTAILSGDGRVFAYIDQETGEPMLCELSNGKMRSLIAKRTKVSGREFAGHAAVSPDSRRIAYNWFNARGGCELRVVDSDASSDRILLFDEKIPYLHPADWTSDSRWILAFLTQTDFKHLIVLVSADDGTVRPLKEITGLPPQRLKLSPCGRYLAYELPQNAESPEHDIFGFDIDTGQDISLVAQPGDDSLLGWTQGSTGIVYAAGRGQATDIWILPLAQARAHPNARLLRSDIGWIHPIGFSRDGDLYFEKRSGSGPDPGLSPGLTEIWSLPDILPEDSRSLIVPDDFPTIQAAVASARPGDAVYVRKGVYREHVMLDKAMTLQGEDREATIIEGGGSGNVVHITADGVTCSGFTVRNGEYGLNLISDQPVHHITLKHLIVTSNLRDGIICRKTEGYNAIEDCVLSNNGGMGLFAHQFSESAIRNCEVYGNNSGILIGWSWYSVIQDNVIYRNNNGIYIDSCYYTTAKNNLIHVNSAGITLGYIASRNTIRENILLNNKESGISLSLLWAGIGENRLYHNDIANPEVNVHKDMRVDFQFWDNGYPSGGNFWSDYNGQDTNRDGIGDTPYMLSDKTGDGFPLIRPWNKIPAVVAIGPGGRSLEGGRSRVEVYIGLPAGIPIEEIDVSSLRLNGKNALDQRKITVGDSDHDGARVLRLTVFGEDLGAVSPSGKGGGLAVSGKLKNGIAFEGSCSIEPLTKNRPEGRNIGGDLK